ncbi:MAG: LCP family protein [Anaerolineae bacterium]|nr:LCP family protein [Anaerolineae bacterium]MDW8172155.1 LCP family protein [Anaerolineae bacterium]
MRIPPWLLALLGFSTLIVSTLVCAFLAYNGVRGVVIDLWDSGLQVNSPNQVIQALSNPEGVAFASTPTSASAQATPTITPIRIDPNAVAANSPAPTATPQDQQHQVEANPAPATTAAPESISDPNAQYRWDDPRQVRILLMGIDERRGFDQERAYRTDTIIVVNVDPVRKTAGVISFPRDLWVAIPNFQPGRINTANFIGDNVQYPGGGGPALLAETIRANFGIRIDYYVRVNFTLFETVVNALAPQGVRVCVDQPIYDPKYPDAGYGTMEVRFEVGCQNLDGARLLQYARTRATQGGDIDRAKRQQQVLDALRAQVLSVGGMSAFLGQIPSLWNELSDSYQTNLALDQLIRLGFLMGEIPRESITFAVVDTNYVELGKSPDGQDVLLPIASRVSDLVQRVLYPQVQVDGGDLLARSRAENAPIRVFNGTQTAGLAGRTQEWLIGRGVTVVGTGNAPAHNGGPTIIQDYGGSPWTARYLANLLGLGPERIRPGTDGLAANGVAIIAGSDMEQILARP